MGFGNIVEQAQVLSRRRERLPRVAALVAMHGSSSRRDSHIFWVAYSDHAGGLGGVSLPGRETCLLSTVRPGEQQWDEGSPLPFAGTSMLLSSNHLQAAALALLRHQLNWQTGCLSLKICGCPSCPALCQSMQQLWSDPKRFSPDNINKKSSPCGSLLSACLGVVLRPGKLKQSQLCYSTGKKFYWCASWCCTQASPRALLMPVMTALPSFSPWL